MSGINPGRGRIVFETAVRILENEKTILLGWPPLREDTTHIWAGAAGTPKGSARTGCTATGSSGWSGRPPENHAVDAGTGGHGRATVWASDLTHGYIDINADYRS